MSRFGAQNRCDVCRALLPLPEVTSPVIWVLCDGHMREWMHSDFLVTKYTVWLVRTVQRERVSRLIRELVP